MQITSIGIDLGKTTFHLVARKYAPFLRRRDEQKAQTYDKWISHSLSSRHGRNLNKSMHIYAN
jgi:hypothetical protein